MLKGRALGRSESLDRTSFIVGAFVGPLVGILVDPLVGSNLTVRMLCA